MEDVGAPEASTGGGTSGAGKQNESLPDQAEVALARLERERAHGAEEPSDDWIEYKSQQRRVKVNRRREEAIKSETRVEKLPAASGEEEFANLVKLVTKTLVPVEEPVALISQVPRSGGTLLRHLFDGHHECHVHPYEWHFGERKTSWPNLSGDALAGGVVVKAPRGNSGPQVHERNQARPDEGSDPGEGPTARPNGPDGPAAAVATFAVREADEANAR